MLVSIVEHAEIQHAFENFIDKGKYHYLILNFAKADESGFDFSIRMCPDGLIFFVEWEHVHFDDSLPFEWPDEKRMLEAFNLVSCLLSPAMRYREKYSISKDPYWSALEYFDGHKWRTYSKRLNLLPHWKRKERILQNRILDNTEFHPLHSRSTNPLPCDQGEGP